MAARKLRLLCLHGFRQNASLFQVRMGALRRELDDIVEFLFIDARFQASVESESTQQFLWWDAQGTEYVGWRESVDYIAEKFEELGPIDGVLGFSQGAAMASLLCLLQSRNDDQDNSVPFAFKFAILVGGFLPRAQDLKELYDTCSSIQIPSLHVIGDTDQFVSPEVSRILLEKFHNPELLQHNGGHLVPSGKEHRAQFRSFIVSIQSTL